MIDDDPIEQTKAEPDLSTTEPSKRTLIGYFASDTDIDALVDLILETVPADQRLAEDRPERLPKPL